MEEEIEKVSFNNRNLERETEQENERLELLNDQIAEATRAIREDYENSFGLKGYLKMCQMKTIASESIDDPEDIIAEFNANQGGDDNAELQAYHQSTIDEIRKLWHEGNGKGLSLKEHWAKLSAFWDDYNKQIAELGVEIPITYGKPDTEDYKHIK
ncbi:hypothetical protein BKA80DRAFT_299844 [Phyllosticta citrichinensis]